MWTQASLRAAFGRHRSALTALALAAATAALAPCDEPQAPTADPNAPYRAAFEPGTLALRIDGPGGAALQLVATDVALDPATDIVTAQVALRNSSRTEVAGPASILVSDFDPASVSPVNGACNECVACPRVCQFDHSGTYGEDGQLSPGETSEPRPWAFHVPGGASFAFRARIAADPPAGSGTIAGTVFLDSNADGRQDSGDPGLPGRPVVLRTDGRAQETTTGARGQFAFRVQAPGLYLLDLVPTNFCVETTPTSIQVLVVRLPDGSLSSYDGARFGCRGDAPPDRGIAISGLVFVDRDRNGVQDRGEAGLAGVLVVGSVPSCPTFAPIEARTDAAGHYRMHVPDCPPPYQVHRESLVGYADTTPNPLVFTEPARVLRADFGVAPPDSSRRRR